jgi:hypothetical protein
MSTVVLFPMGGVGNVRWERDQQLRTQPLPGHGTPMSI